MKSNICKKKRIETKIVNHCRQNKQKILEFYDIFKKHSSNQTHNNKKNNDPCVWQVRYLYLIFGRCNMTCNRCDTCRPNGIREIVSVWQH